VSFLGEFDTAAVGQKFTLVLQWLKNNPLELFESLREHRPILPTDGPTLVARHADVCEVLDNPGTFTVNLNKLKMGDFRTDRPAYAYLHFGRGHHQCLGMHVAGVMVPEIVKHLLLLKNLRPAPGADGRIDCRGGPLPERYVLEFDL
jgi:cytochrome P450